MSLTIYYCGFNGFSQVPNQSENSTLTSFVIHSKNVPVKDLVICWNFLAYSTESSPHIIKYGLVQSEGSSRSTRYTLPNGCGNVKHLSASPRHLLVVTQSGETWSHEETKGWRRIFVGSDTFISENDTETSNEENPVNMVKTSCGDNYNLGLDSSGTAYALPHSRLIDDRPRVTDVSCGKEHNLLLTEDGRVFSWGGGSRGQLGHGSLSSEESPRLLEALDGIKIVKIAAGGWHSAVVSEENDLYTFGWNESGQLAQFTNLAKPPECFSAVEKLLMACCTMQSEDGFALRGDTEEEVYRKPGAGRDPEEESCSEKDALTNCINVGACNSETDSVSVQALPIHVQIPGKTSEESKVISVDCGSRHTVVLTSGNNVWAFGWNKYGQLGLGHTASRDNVEKVPLHKSFNSSNKIIKDVICGDWGTALIVKE